MVVMVVVVVVVVAVAAAVVVAAAAAAAAAAAVVRCDLHGDGGDDVVHAGGEVRDGGVRGVGQVLGRCSLLSNLVCCVPSLLQLQQQRASS